MYFNQKEQGLIQQLGEVAYLNLNLNDKRVVNSVYQLLDVFASACRRNNQDKFSGIRIEFESIVEWDLEDLFSELLTACLNTSQAERGLKAIDLAVSLGLYQEHDLFNDKSAFMCLLNRQEEAEKMLKELLEDDPNNLWLYIGLGDIYFINTLIDESQDLVKAEYWYYQAYDREIGMDDQESWEVLLERLGDAAIKRLKNESEKRLLELLIKHKIGTYKTIAQLKNNVYISSYDSVILQHLQMQAYQKIKELEEANDALQIINDAYNLMPQKNLDGLSPFETNEYMPKGKHELRIVDEMIAEFFKNISHEEGKEEEAGVLGSQEFSDFQIKFFEQKDPLTNKKRRTLIDNERKKTKRDYEGGKLIWGGFTKYRNQ